MNDHEVWISAIRDGDGGADLEVACSCDVIVLTLHDDGRSGVSVTLDTIREAVRQHMAAAGEAAET